MTFLTPSSAMREAGRETLGNEPILASFLLIYATSSTTLVTNSHVYSNKYQTTDNFSLGEPIPNISDDIYAEKVRGIQDHIRSGDICQAVLARHFVSPIVA